MKKKQVEPILSEQYIIYYQYLDVDGFTKNGTYQVNLESKLMNKQAEAIFLKEHSGKFKELKIQKIVYQ